jgi:hypothetical protein
MDLLQYLTISNQVENYNKGKVGEHLSSLTWDKEGQLLFEIALSSQWSLENHKPQAFEVNFG